MAHQAAPACVQNVEAEGCCFITTCLEHRHLLQARWDEQLVYHVAGVGMQMMRGSLVIASTFRQLAFAMTSWSKVTLSWP